MKHLRGILFDNDGTLVDTHSLIMESFEYATQRLLGRTISEEEVAATGGRPLDEQMLIFAQGDQELAAELSHVYREYNHAIHDERIRAFDGVEEGLAKLHEHGFSMGVVTSKMRWLALRGLEACGIERYFGCCIGADSCEQHKPHPAPLIMGARELGLDPETCAYVGDSPFDIQAANAARCVSVAALWGMFDQEDVRRQNPAYAFSSFAEFVDAVTGI